MSSKTPSLERIREPGNPENLARDFNTLKPRGPRDPQGGAAFPHANAAKAKFKDAYDLETPALYLSELGALDYRIPDEAAEPIRRLVNEIARKPSQNPPTVLDLGCSYGINAAILKQRTSFRALWERYVGREGEPRRLAVQKDREFFGAQARADQPRVIGLDVAQNAVNYAIDSGLLDAGITANLEVGPLSSSDASLLADVDLIMSTGCVGYVTEATFERVLQPLQRSRKRPLVASFVLRMFPYAGIQRLLDRYGYTTERVPGVFRQRRFKNDNERKDVFRALHGLGLNPDDAERDGYLHAELFISRAHG